MAPLDRALALDERDHGAVLVAEQLDLDVPRLHDPALEIDARSRRTPSRLPSARSGPPSSSVAAALDDAHALAAAARHRLHHQRVADVVARSRAISSSVAPAPSGASVPGTTGTPARIATLARAGLAAHQRDRLGRRADERQAGVAARARERGVLGEEPVAGMDGVGAGRGCAASISVSMRR